MNPAFILFHLLPCLSITLAKKEPVRMPNGNTLNDALIYMIQSQDSRFGGLRGRAVDNTNCSTLLVYESGSNDSGEITGFRSVNPMFDMVIRLSTDINIVFPETTAWVPPACTKRRLWQISYDKQENQYFVVSGLDEKRNGSFRIEKLGSSYYFQFCQFKTKCKSVGIYVKDGLRRLALSDVPLRVKFGGGFITYSSD